MRRVLKNAAKFFVALIVMTICCALAWEVVSEQFYDCTDAASFDYLQPGNWVHRDVVIVDRVIHHRSMSEPDTIKAGWTVARLWVLWYSFVACSGIVSLLLAFVPWARKRSKQTNSLPLPAQT
jgi:hypothetical protein